jgi:hypothetical protein
VNDEELPRRRASGEWENELLCPTCEKRFASEVFTRIHVALEPIHDDQEADRRHNGTDPALLALLRKGREVKMGQKVLLDPGYVNALRPWLEMLPWYVPGKRASSPSPTVRLPAHLTCRCGQGLILQTPAVNSVYSIGSPGMRAIQLENDLALAEDGEDWGREEEEDRGR